VEKNRLNKPFSELYCICLSPAWCPNPWGTDFYFSPTQTHRWPSKNKASGDTKGLRTPLYNHWFSTCSAAVLQYLQKYSSNNLRGTVLIYLDGNLRRLMVMLFCTYHKRCF